MQPLTIPAGLDGPPGILQGGLATTLLIDIARRVDPFGSPVTGVHARLLAPTPIGRTIDARVRGTEEVAVSEVELVDRGRVLVSGTVELAGHDPAMHVHDLVDMAAGPLPDAKPQTMWNTCWVCGAEATGPCAQRVFPGWRRAGTVVSAWMGEAELAHDGIVAPVVVGAVLDCPATWACRDAAAASGQVGPMLAEFIVRFVRDVAALEPLRIVGHLDAADGRVFRTRSALVDDDGVVFAVASGVHVGVRDAVR
ncbi:MAG: hotdog fold domain-containing protein [Nitriliruptoraceae bacterium]